MNLPLLSETGAEGRYPVNYYLEIETEDGQPALVGTPGTKVFDVAWAELVTNGTFDSNITGWNNDGVAPYETLEWQSGKLHAVNTTNTGFVNSDDNISVTAGRLYKITFDLDISSGQGPGCIMARAIRGDRLCTMFEIGDGTNGSHVFYWTPTTTENVLFEAVVNQNSDFTLDNVSIQEIVTGQPVRNLNVMGDYLYVVCGNTFYQVDSSGAATSKGTINSTTGYVWIENNGLQVMVVDSVTNEGYIYTLSNDTFAQITDADFPGAGSLTYQDGYFIITQPDTDYVFLSDINDGTSWDALKYAAAEGDPGNLVAVLSDHRELFVFGENASEVWWNSGASYPFDRREGVYLEVGLGAAASLAKVDNSVFWLDDKGMVRRLHGYDPEFVSTRRLEKIIAGYSTVSDAIGFGYVDQGHSFYQLTFPTANATWCYDTATKRWHERTSYPGSNRHRANCYAYFNRKHIIGDYENGKLYELDHDTYTDNSETVQRVHVFPKVRADRFHRLRINFKSGTGLVTGQGSDPQAMLDWSDDDCRTWSNEHWADIGEIGEYTRRSVWYQMGRSESGFRNYRVTVSDPVELVIRSADLKATRNGRKI